MRMRLQMRLHMCVLVYVRACYGRVCTCMRSCRVSVCAVSVSVPARVCVDVCSCLPTAALASEEGVTARGARPLQCAVLAAAQLDHRQFGSS